MKLPLAIAILASAIVALCGIALAAPRATITVGNNFLAPANKTVSAGTTVRFRWAGGERHHIVKTKGPGAPIASKATAKRGVNLSRRLRKAGTYRFICTIHPTEMRLKLVVR